MNYNVLNTIIMKRVKIKHLFLLLLLVISKSVYPQYKITLSTDTTTTDLAFYRFKGDFIINDKIGFGTYNIFYITPIDTVEMDSWLYTTTFGENKENIKSITFTLITCKEHDNYRFGDRKVGDSLELKVKTPDGAWFLYGCFHDDNARQYLTLPCGCERSVPLYIIKTQVLVIDE